MPVDTVHPSQGSLAFCVALARGPEALLQDPGIGPPIRVPLKPFDNHGVRSHLIYRDVASSRSLARSGWQGLMEVVRPGDTIVVTFLDRLSRNFEEGVRIQADLIDRDIGIVAIRENIDTRDSSAAGKYFRRAMLALGAYQVDATSERIRDGQARARGRDAASAGPPP